jgi:PAT family beta-lactamase induction signal transducer AmpG
MPRLSFAAAFRSRRVGVMVALGLASALPSAMTDSVLNAWATALGVDLKTIGYFALVSLPYNFKFVLAPFLDRYPLPILGRRRGWLFFFLLVATALAVVLGSSDPAARTGVVAALAVALAFAGAAFDLVLDAYRVDVLPEDERAAGTATYIAGYRVALLITGSLSLVLAEFVGWRVVYLGLAALLLLGVVGVLIAPEPPPSASKPPRTLLDALYRPFVEFFFHRRGSLLLLVFILIYTYGDWVVLRMLVPFYLRVVEFSLLEIGLINKITIAGATILGAAAAGVLVPRLGLRRSLILFGAAAALTNLLYLLLLATGKSYVTLVVAVGLDNLASGLRATAFTAFLMALCDRRYSATQYALFSSAMSLVGRLAASLSGHLVEGFGWPAFFGVTSALAIPALAILLLANRTFAEVEARSAEVSGSS